MVRKRMRKALKRRLRKERQEKEAQEIKRRKRNKILKILIPIIALIGVASFSINWWLGESPRIEVVPDHYNFGDVNTPVSILLTVKNVGKSDLILNNMDSSCGCTSASLIVDGKEGPRFSMASHGTNPKDWSATLTTGETAQLKIYYDPYVHRNFRGWVTRTVTLYSNDPINFRKEIRISANQV